MKKIFINKTLEESAIHYSKNLFSTRPPNFERPKFKLHKLAEDIKTMHTDYAKYIDKIIAEYEELNALKPSKINAKKAEFDKIVPENKLNDLIPVTATKNGIIFTEDRCFYDLVVEAMRYDAVRNKDFLPYIKKIGIKSCVYCNAQFTVIAEVDEDDNLSAKLELDHHYAKSKYPFLCTSFFNLYPSCSNCNKAKSKNDAVFELYSEDDKDLEVFVFILSDKSVIKYLNSRNVNDIHFDFKTKDGLPDISEEHDKMFCIKGIYETQKDIIEELIHKKEAYSELYKNDLVDMFHHLFLDKALINRLVIGNYINSEEIHKRPMSKFMQDIARDLDLIK